MQPANDHFLLDFDIVTGGGTAVLVTPDGEIVATASRSHAVSLPRAGWAETAADLLAVET